MLRHASEPIPSGRWSRSPDNRGTYFPDWMLGLEGFKVTYGLRLGQVLGTGAFGVVYAGACPQISNNGPVAVKVLSATGIDSQRHQQIEHEMLYHSRVSEHPNIVTFHTMVASQWAYYAIMDLHEDGDMFKCITEDEFYAGNDSLIKTVFSQLLDAVAFCHKMGVYHRDLKPENILCRNGGSTVLLTDFGLATRDKFSQDFRCGSELYMSPECMGHFKVEAYSTVHNDIWALGVILINLITSRNPWKYAHSQDKAFASFYKDRKFYIRNSFPVSCDVRLLLLRIFNMPSEPQISIRRIRATITSIDRLLLTPAEAASAPNDSRMIAEQIFNTTGARRPHLLVEHYEDICAHFPDLARDLCENLRLGMTERGLINDVDDLFSKHASEPVRYIRQEVSEWSVPIPIEIRPKELEDVTGYPQSPDMSRDNSFETIASGGPITPDTHPIYVVDDVPEVILDGAESLEERLGDMKIDNPADIPSVSPLSTFSSRIARVLGSTGSFFR